MITYDLLIIGSGPAGQRAAIYANKLGKRAAVVERMRTDRWGLGKYRHHPQQDDARSRSASLRL